jgi:hypothetical protein
MEPKAVAVTARLRPTARGIAPVTLAAPARVVAARRVTEAATVAVAASSGCTPIARDPAPVAVTARVRA